VTAPQVSATRQDPRSEGGADTVATKRHYLMCRPDFFTVSYEINPWMDASLPTDRDLALAQWQRLHDVYLELGHTVELIDPLPGYPDMVFAANGATVVDDVVYSARFLHTERAAEGPAFLQWFIDQGYTAHAAVEVNEGQGDLLTVGDVILAGTGYRTVPAAHAEAREVFDRPVISLDLVDPRFYHLDTALTVLQADRARPEIAYYPPAFSLPSRAVLKEMFPDALLATDADATALGLNAVSDGLHVVVTLDAVTFQAQLRERGYVPVPVDTSELRKGGGGAKCCTLELCTSHVDSNLDGRSA
jgi:N-dimethylarginine dimethylaminohydrolase